ncbi:MAG: polysaccharide biosynthesis protein [Planctomycetota bacterium]|jgi:UDP-glucose 4-epimerase
MIFKGKSILVIGGTGSLGQVLVRRILTDELGKPSKVIVMSRDEAKQQAMRVSYMHKKVTTDEVIYNNFKQLLEFRIGNVRNYADVCSAVKDSNIVINAAALKQVPLCEYFPEQAMQTNCLGPVNIVRAIRENDYPVDIVVGISTDKACKPVNVMGMSKAIQERIFVSANVMIPKTRFNCVRYGNVLASRGSVIPLFHEQIKSGGPVTITAANMTRFLLSIDQGVDTVFAVLSKSKAGEIYIPIVDSATVENMAKALIGSRKIETKIIGIRPGEKMHEILVSEEECHHVIKRGDYYVILPMLPELRTTEQEAPNALDGEFCSADNVLDLEGTIELMAKHDLNVPSGLPAETEELLR